MAQAGASVPTNSEVVRDATANPDSKEWSIANRKKQAKAPTPRKPAVAPSTLSLSTAETQQNDVSAEAKPILTTSIKGGFELRLESLKNILLADDVVDKPVVVISVAGAFRQGKSFLLDIMLRYLTAPDKSNWLNEQSTRGFPWQCGYKRHTDGILMWSKPLPVTLPTGEEAVIVLMDTQGTFDNQSTKHQSSTVFALSTLLSSLQIFNLMKNLKNDDLEHLQLFTEYGRMALEDTSTKPFQKLLILVRDWMFTHDLPPGAAGGDQLLRDWLQDKSVNKELSDVHKHITDCFTEINGFLLPFPGEQVASNPSFNGSSNDMNPAFVTGLKELLPKILAPENLTVKNIAGNPVKASDLYVYFQSYVKLFDSGEIPRAKNIMQATAQANNMTALREATSQYVTDMECICCENKPSLDKYKLLEKHREAASKAAKTFDDRKKMGDRQTSDEYRKKLVQEMEDRFKSTEQENNTKRENERLEAENHNLLLVDNCKIAYISEMEPVAGETVSFVPQEDMNSAHEVAQQKAIDQFDDEKKMFDGAESLSHSKLAQDIADLFRKMLLHNDVKKDAENLKASQANMKAVGEAAKTYRSKMNTIMSSAPLPTEELENRHQQELQAAIEMFESIKEGDEIITLSYLENLKSDIDCEKEKLYAANHNIGLVGLCKMTYTKEMEPVASEAVGYIPQKDMNSANKAAEQKAMDRFNAEKKELNGAELSRCSELTQAIAAEFHYMLLNNQVKENVKDNKAAQANMKAVGKATMSYKSKMNAIMFSAPLPLEELQNQHHRALQAAIEMFDSIKEGDEIKTVSYLENMKSDIDCEKEKLYAENHNIGLVVTCKMTYKSDMESVAGENVGYVPEQDFNCVHEKAQRKAIEQFDASKTVYDGAELLSRSKLVQDIAADFRQMMFQNGMKKDAQNIKAAHANMKACNEAMKSYRSLINAKMSNAQLPTVQLQNWHQQALQAAIERFDSLKEGDEVITGSYLENMKSDIDTEKEKLYAENHNIGLVDSCKMTYIRNMERVAGTTVGYVPQMDINSAHEVAKQRAINQFDTEKKVFDGVQLSIHCKLAEEIAAEFRKILINNDVKKAAENHKAAQTNTKAVREATKIYKSKMKTIMSSAPLPTEELQNQHHQALQAAIERFDSLKEGDEVITGSYLENMKSDIDSEKEKLYAKNHNIGLVDTCKMAYIRNMEKVDGAADGYVSQRHMDSAHEVAKHRAIDQFDTAKKALDGAELVSRSKLAQDIDVEFRLMLINNQVKTAENQKTEQVNIKAVNEATRIYKSKMNVIMSSAPLPTKELQNQHHQALHAAIERFESIKKGDELITVDHLENLRSGIDCEKEKLYAENHNMGLVDTCKKVYIRNMKQVDGAADGYVSQRQMDSAHEVAKQRAIDQFDTEKVSNGVEWLSRSKLVKEIATEFQQIQLQNDGQKSAKKQELEQVNMKAVIQATTNYITIMNAAMTSAPLPPENLDNAHQKALQVAIETFESHQECSELITNDYLKIMKSNIDTEMKKYKDANSQKTVNMLHGEVQSLQKTIMDAEREKKRKEEYAEIMRKKKEEDDKLWWWQKIPGFIG